MGGGGGKTTTYIPAEYKKIVGEFLNSSLGSFNKGLSIYDPTISARADWEAANTGGRGLSAPPESGLIASATGGSRSPAMQRYLDDVQL